MWSFSGAIMPQGMLIIHARLFVASSKPQSEDKPDMFEANKTYLCKTRNSVGSRIPCASTHTARSQALFEPGPACVNEPSSSKYTLADMGITVPVSVFSLTGNTSLPQIQA